MAARRLWPLAGGTMTAHRSNIHLGEPSGPLVLPLPAYLIEHDRGLVLFDTGVRPDAHDRSTREAYGDVIADSLPVQCPPENRLDLQINKAGFDVSDVTHVVVSHAHFDHTGGLYLFPDADFYMQLAELQNAFWPAIPFWDSVFGREDLERARGFTWHPLTSDLDLFGDGSMQILRTPGHTPGHQSLLVKLGSRSFMLAADAGHTLTNFQGVPCPADFNSTEAQHSIQRIKDIAAAHEALIWVMHDPGQWDELGHVTEPYT